MLSEQTVAAAEIANRVARGRQLSRNDSLLSNSGSPTPRSKLQKQSSKQLVLGRKSSVPADKTPSRKLSKQGSFSLTPMRNRSTTLKAKLRKQGSISNMNRDGSQASIKESSLKDNASQKSITAPPPVAKKETKLPEIKNLAKF